MLIFFSFAVHVTGSGGTKDRIVLFLPFYDCAFLFCCFYFGVSVTGSDIIKDPFVSFPLFYYTYFLFSSLAFLKNDPIV